MNLTLGRKNARTEMDRAGQQAIPAGDRRCLEFRGYLDANTFRPGEEVSVKVHPTASTFDLEVVHDSGDGQCVYSTAGTAGRPQETPRDAYAVGSGWDDSHTFHIVPDWPAGVYLVIPRTHTDAVPDSPAAASSRKRGAISSAKEEIVSSISRWPAPKLGLSTKRSTPRSE